jgi:hypothetical protein
MMRPTTEPGTTLAEKLGASAGMWAVLWLMLHYLILREAAADPVLPADEYVAALLNERMRWEWATALRLMGGIMIVWFMGSLSGRLRLIEGEPGRLASIAFGIGAIWGTVWILSAMFNSLGILLATLYDNPDGARLLGVLAREAPLVLTPSIVFTLALATSFVALRFGGFPPAYTLATAGLTALFLVLALMDWYGPGNLAPLIMLIALAWLAVTSALVVPAYRPPDLVRGGR